MSSDWTNRIKIFNTEDGGEATFAKYSAAKDWHTRPQDDQDRILDEHVFKGYGKGMLQAPTDWFNFQVHESGGGGKGGVHVTFSGSADVEHQAGATPHLEMRVDNDPGHAGFDEVLTLAVWDRQGGWHDVPGQDIDPLIKSTLDPLKMIDSPHDVEFVFVV
jgi:hypothetical protein